MSKSKRGRLTTGAALMLCWAQPAAAAETFQFNIAATGIVIFNASGTLVTTSTTTLVNGRQAYTITGLSGTINGLAIGSLLPSGSQHFLGNTDNLSFCRRTLYDGRRVRLHER